ncbi:protein of unknown function [Candidatus Hydrogenisulfobacillus filiaventi]|uniref:Ribulose bisphosphate carboxylase large subunit C-terminal domain-containing protein n=1 Tax=Candidatus Hydrogenisulfobacillus filiaventi TaxID=2707344 RepID=A0A6F8ZCW5_9FIRM|nr:protein of unknown function [Candidatus Hydrogenisulfobacillus filiaventi]
MPSGCGWRVDHIHAGTVVGKLEGDPRTVQGFYKTLREYKVAADPSLGLFFDQDWGLMPGTMPVASGAFTRGRCTCCCTTWGGRHLPVRGGTFGHPMGPGAGATANRVAVEAMIQARNEGRDILAEGPAILEAAAKWSPALRANLETWKDVTFNFESTDTPDVLPTPSF